MFFTMAGYPALAQVTETFSSSGTWTCPAGVTSVTVECWGGGGGGGRGLGASPSTSRGSGGGGAGGAYASSTITVVPGTNYAIMVGSGGLGGATSTNSSVDGLSGGDSWFIDNTTVLAKGGTGGFGGTSGAGTGGTNATAGSGTTVFAGGNGATGMNGSATQGAFSGGGGGSAGSMGAGGIASGVNGGAAGSGGGAAGANGRSGTGAGYNGSVPGSGGGGGRASSITFSGGNGGNGQVKLTYTPPPPGNDEASGAIALTVNNDNNCTQTNMGTTAGATQSADAAPECLATATQDDVWYSFTATATTHRITFSGTASVMATAIYSGTIGSLMPVPSACAGNNALTASGLTPGVMYYIRAYTAAGGNAYAAFNICVGIPEAPPANDDCASAIAVNSIPYSNNQTMSGSATQSGFQNTCSTAMNDGVWYKFTGTGSTIEITADPNGNLDLAIGIYSGASCTALSCVAIDNDTTGGGTENYTFTSVAGTTYYVNIGYPSGTANGEEGAFLLRIEDAVPVNDDADAATLLTLGSGCSNIQYSNNGATLSSEEPYPSCRVASSSNNNAWPVRFPVWFKFIAPASGAVRISTDNGGTIAGSGIRTAVFTATDSSNYSTFNIIHCAGNSGINAPYTNIFYPAGLTPGATYYIAVDVYSTSAQGTFCITADELDNSMIATAPADCVNGDDMGSNPWTGVNGSYKGWMSLVDNEGKLNANVRQTTGNAKTFSTSRTIKTGTLRTDADGTTYMNRNLLINSAGDTGTVSADLQLFFTDAELTEMGASSVTALNITKVTDDTCRADFIDGSGATTLLTQTAHSAINGVHMIQVTTPGFSNFFIHQGTTPLPLELIRFTGRYRNGNNVLNWQTAAEMNLSHFELQRSADGKQFEAVGKINAKGERNNDYTFSDLNILTGKNIYRLKMIDRDGAFSYSNTIEVNNDRKNGFRMTAGPNPVKGLLHINLEGVTAQAGYLQITDLYGKTVYSVQPKGDHITIDMSTLASGSYYVRYTDALITRTLKIVKD